ncbi:MAG: aminoglycoside phosphotransferase family protein [Alphaproteobacteria bacterium]|nr:aminoglycoside phosphotransferase family protein [Alphaproteobacteria bacterium]
MIFKNQWEKTSHHFEVSSQTIQEIVHQALPHAILVSHEVISGGCANLNIKINLLNKSQPFILRIYIRDKDAAYREKKLAALIKHSVPLPEVYSVGDFDNYRYAITQFMTGISLRDLLLNQSHECMQDVMFEAGQILGAIQSHLFPKAGFFDADLNVIQSISKQDCLTFAHECLAHPTIFETIGPEYIRRLSENFEKYSSFFPDDSETHLVHGDYDPANILVDKVSEKWKITAVLDWEFAFSGSWLWDISNMLRYAHHMPRVFEDSFLQGVRNAGLELPTQWCLRIDLLNLLSLLSCLVRVDPQKSPNQCMDICELIHHELLKLEKGYEGTKSDSATDLNSS